VCTVLSLTVSVPVRGCLARKELSTCKEAASVEVCVGAENCLCAYVYVCAVVCLVVAVRAARNDYKTVELCS